MQNRNENEPEVKDGSETWFKAFRNPEALELMKASPNAFCLLYLIAYRAQRTAGFNRHNLKPSQALVGDYRKMGMTEQNYRTAKAFLEKHDFATFKPTNKGTIATLSDTRIFDINIEAGNEQNNERVTDGQRTGNGRVTTTKNGKKENNSKKAKNPYGPEGRRTVSGGGKKLSGNRVRGLAKVWDDSCRKYYPGEYIAGVSDSEAETLEELFARHALPGGITTDDFIDFVTGCWDVIGDEEFAWMGRRNKKNPKPGQPYPKLPSIPLLNRFFSKFANLWPRRSELMRHSQRCKEAGQREAQRRRKATAPGDEEDEAPCPTDKAAYAQYEKERAERNRPQAKRIPTKELGDFDDGDLFFGKFEDVAEK